MYLLRLANSIYLNLQKLQGSGYATSFAVTVAVRGTLYSNAMQPKACPPNMARRSVNVYLAESPPQTDQN